MDVCIVETLREQVNLMNISEANDIALTTINRMASEHGYVRTTHGWTKHCQKTVMKSCYTICLPAAGSNYEFISSDANLALVVGVNVEPIDEITSQLGLSSSKAGPFSFVTGNELVCRNLPVKPKLDLNAGADDFQQNVLDYVCSFTSCLDETLYRICKPSYLLKAFKKPVSIFFTTDLILKEIALNVYLKDYSNAIMLAELIKNGIKDVVSSSDVAKMKSILQEFMPESEFDKDRPESTNSSAVAHLFDIP